MAARYRVTAPYVTVKVSVDGGTAIRGFYADAVIEADEDAVAHLLRKGMVEELSEDEAPEPEPTGDPEPFTASGLAGLTVKEILDQVGDDPEKAASVLEAEQSRGDDARSTLVEKLQAIAAPASSTGA